jgi:ABC-2 type transport system permease protein
MTLLNKIWAFLKRDFENTTSYKLSFVLGILNIFLSILMFYFISRLIGSSAAQHLDVYGGDYFAFYLVGAAFSAYFWTWFSTFAGTIMAGQASGTLEIMLATPTKLPTILLASSAFKFIYTTINVILYIVAGILLGVNFGSANLGAASVIFILTILTFSSLGLISAALILIFKRDDPVAWFLGQIGTLLGGSLFPITILPLWLQKVSAINPITYALRSMRLALLQGHTISMLSNDILALIIFSAVLFPLGMLFFNFCIKKAKKDGSLLKY